MAPNNGNTALLPAVGLVSTPVDIAEEALSFAVEFCRSRAASTVDRLALLTQNRAGIHDYFRYGLALRLAKYVGELDAAVTAVYVSNWDQPVSEEIAADPVEVTSPLHLILRVSRKTAALERLIADLDVHLTRRYRELVAPRADKLRSLIDAHIVDEQEVLERADSAALLTSVHSRPIKVWERAGSS